MTSIRGIYDDTHDSDWFIGSHSTVSDSAVWMLSVGGLFRPQPKMVELKFTMGGGEFDAPEITKAWAGERCVGPPPERIPAVSAWGLAILTLLLLTGLKIKFGRRSAFRA